MAVYAPGSKSPLRTIRKGGTEDPGALALDGSGDLYVANGNDTVTVYAPGTRSVLRTISQGVYGASALGFDSSG